MISVLESGNIDETTTKVNNAGSGYKLGDIITVKNGNNTFITLNITEIEDYGHSPIIGWAFDGYPIMDR